MDINRNRRTFRYLGKVIDAINVALAMIVIVAAIFIVIDIEKYMIMFPIVFLASSFMNFALGLKIYKRRENMHGIVLLIAGLVMLALSIIGFVVAL